MYAYLSIEFLLEEVVRLKKYFAALLILICARHPAQAENLLLIHDNSVFSQYIDADSISDRGGYVEVWEKQVPKELRAELSEDGTGKVTAHIMSLMALDKKAKQAQLLAIRIYGGDGEILLDESTYFRETGFLAIAPKTSYERLYDFVIALADILEYEKMVPAPCGLPEFPLQQTVPFHGGRAADTAISTPGL